MSETPIEDIDMEQVLGLTVHDNSGDDYVVENATIIGAERDGDELKVWVDGEMR